ncbi:MAG: pilus assembly protein [Proteobacteria bacterium]|nr:pilus assembly protein [Pseudomonadota bacterium]
MKWPFQAKYFAARFPCKALLRSETGGMMVEFAFVAPFVILLMVSTIEVGMTLFVGAALEGAAESAARQIRTGQVQVAANPLETFRTRLCAELFNLIDCNEVAFDVRKFDSFESVDTTLQFDEDGALVDAAFTPGDSGDITIVRVLYRWQYMTPLVAQALSSDGSGGTLLMATMAFQNEPYELGG